MCLEHLFSELLVALAALDSVHLESVGVCVHVMVLGEEVRYGVESSHEETNHANHNFLVRHLVACDVSQVLGNIMSHLRGGSGSSVFVFNHTIVELRGHSDDHVIVVRVIVTTFRHIETERRVIVVTCEQVVGVVDQTWLMGVSLGKFGRPDTIVSILGLMHGEVRSPHSVLDDSLSVVPLLEVVALVFLMGGVNSWCEDHLADKFSLLESLVHKQIVLLMHSSVATLARSLEHLETSSQTIGKLILQVSYVAEL